MEIMYTERYMDHPDNNLEGYNKTNLINKVNLLGRSTFIDSWFTR